MGKRKVKGRSSWHEGISGLVAWEMGKQERKGGRGRAVYVHLLLLGILNSVPFFSEDKSSPFSPVLSISSPTSSLSSKKGRGRAVICFPSFSAGFSQRPKTKDQKLPLSQRPKFASRTRPGPPLCSWITLSRLGNQSEIKVSSKPRLPSEPLPFSPSCSIFEYKICARLRQPKGKLIEKKPKHDTDPSPGPEVILETSSLRINQSRPPLISKLLLQSSPFLSPPHSQSLNPEARASFLAKELRSLFIPGSLVSPWGPWLLNHIYSDSWPLFAEVTGGGQCCRYGH